jgi:hypothetical protein
MNRIFFVVLVVALAGCGPALTPADAGVLPEVTCPEVPLSSVLAEPMRGMSFLIGRWSGSGWIQRGPGAKSTFTQTETVQARLEGAIVTVEGVGKDEADGGAEVVHHAMAVIAWDKGDQRHRFSSYLSDGNFLDAEAKVVDGKLEWGYEDPRAGTIRYVIQLNATGQWHETGHFSRNAGPWVPFFEMTLDRVP